MCIKSFLMWLTSAALLIALLPFRPAQANPASLPIRTASSARCITSYKNGKQRTITVQAFERTVLMYDAQNPL